jgi:GNAT superfamily N-acetyltransferase
MSATHPAAIVNPESVIAGDGSLKWNSLSLQKKKQMPTIEDAVDLDSDPFVGIEKELLEHFEDAASVPDVLEEKEDVEPKRLRVDSMNVSSEESTNEGSQTLHSDSQSETDEREILEKVPRYSTSDVRFVEHVDQSDVALASQVIALSKEAFGECENAMQRRKNERICAMLVGEKVISYASYTLRRDLMALNINKFAVVHTEQKRGLGRIMMRHLTQIAKRRSRTDTPIAVISLSALATAVGFYRACGFHEDHSVNPCSSDDAIEGQVYMEYALKRKRIR